MDWSIQLLLVLGLLFGLLMSGMWLPFAILISGLIAMFASDGWDAFRALGFVLWGGSYNFTLTAIPLFIFMAEILLQSGITQPLYRALARLVRPLPGGLLQTNIVSSAIFAAICGSSVATAAAIGTVALPNLEKRGYPKRMSFGTLAAGGTLGILIPPSIPLILYGSFTEVSVARLFIAGIIPGLLLSLIFMVFVALRMTVFAQNHKSDATVEESTPFLHSVLEIAPFAALILIVLGGIYFGFATPTEAAALGCVFSMIIGALFGNFRLSTLISAVDQSLKSSCAILFIVIAAIVFAYAFEDAGLGSHLTEWIISLDLDRNLFLVALLFLFVALGCLIESIAMIVITVPLLYPTVLAYGIDPIWFGIALVLLIEVGQITPPFGINLFVIKRISDAPLGEIIKGSAPYYLLILGFLLIIALFPAVVTWLPTQMFAR